MPLAFAPGPLVIRLNYGECACIPLPTFELSNAVQLLAKTAPRERKQGPYPEIPCCPEIPSVTLLLTFFNRGPMNRQLLVISGI